MGRLEEPASRPGVTKHLFVSCDKSGESPVLGVRYKQIGANYDLCAAEFEKLTPSEKKSFLAIGIPQTNSQVAGFYVDDARVSQL